MNCTEVDRMLSEGMSRVEILTRGGEHIRGCERCGPMLEFVEAAIVLPLDEGASERRISERLTANLLPAAPMPGPLRNVVGIVGVAAGIWLVWTLMMGVPGFKQLDKMRRLAMTVYSMVLLVLLAVSLVRLMRPASAQPIPPKLLVGAVVVGYPVLASLVFPVQPGHGFVAEGIVCCLFGLITSSLSGALVWGQMRRGYATNGVLAGSVIGAVSGLIGIVALQLICPDHEGAHIAVWHGMVGVLSVAGGSGAGYLASRRA